MADFLYELFMLVKLRSHALYHKNVVQSTSKTATRFNLINHQSKLFSKHWLWKRTCFCCADLARKLYQAVQPNGWLLVGAQRDKWNAYWCLIWASN